MEEKPTVKTITPEEFEEKVEQRARELNPPSEIMCGEIILKAHQPVAELAGLLIELLKNKELRDYIQEFKTKQIKQNPMVS